MRNFIYFLILFIAGLLVLGTKQEVMAQTQDENKAEESVSAKPRIDLGMDLVSRYIFRGKDYGNSPAVQPNFAFSIKGFKIGGWGSYGLTDYHRKVNDSTVVDMGHYAEFDLYLSYTLKWFTLGFTDYFFPNSIDPNTGNKYFMYYNKTTGHTVEASLSFNGTEKVPLQVFAATFFYGADKGKDINGIYGAGDNNNYSIYIEISYLFSIKKIGVDLKPFIGGIPYGSAYYGSKAGIINLGLTASKSVKITTDFSLPVYTSIITNPQAQNTFFVVGITL